MIGVCLSVLSLAPCPCLGLTTVSVSDMGRPVTSTYDRYQECKDLCPSVPLCALQTWPGRLRGQSVLLFYPKRKQTRWTQLVHNAVLGVNRCYSSIHEEITKIVMYAIWECCLYSVATYTSCQPVFLLLLLLIGFPVWFCTREDENNFRRHRCSISKRCWIFGHASQYTSVSAFLIWRCDKFWSWTS